MGCLPSRDAAAALTLKDIEAQQARLLELVSLENFKTQLAGQMAENMNAYMDKHCDIVRGRISKKLEADVNNIEMRIINAVIDNVTTQVLRRLEHKVVLLEKQINESTMQITKMDNNNYNIDDYNDDPRPLVLTHNICPKKEKKE